MTGPGTRVLGRYELGAVLGSGGLAVVHRARDRETGAAVAVKALLPQYAADAELRRRFLREAEALGALQHPGIVGLLDAGAEGAAAYLVMELVPGETLRQRLDREGRLPYAEVKRIGLLLCDALDHAHRSGIVHRDVKPQNVLLREDGAVKLSDFGAARVHALASLSASSLLWGSPEYMAPEQFTGAPVDPRADLYSLGVMLFEALTGRLPFGEGAPLGRLAAGIALPPPETGTPALDRLFALLLHSEPGQRPASASDVGRLLFTDGVEAALAAAPPLPCPRCGAARAAGVPLCLHCGREEIAVRHTPRARARLVLKSMKDEAEPMGRFHEILEELTGYRELRLKFIVGDRRLYSKSEQERAIGLPAVLFRNLALDDAHKLSEEFNARGFNTRVDAGGFFGFLDWRAFRWSAALLFVMVAAFLASASVGQFFWPLVLLWTLGPAYLIAREAFVSRSAHFELQGRGAALPRSRKLLLGASEAMPAFRSPEVRTLFMELNAELYQLSEKAEQAEEGSGIDLGCARILALAPTVQQRLLSLARRLDELDQALNEKGEADLHKTLQRLERRLAATAAEDEREATEQARAEVQQALERRRHSEKERAELFAALLALLSRTRDLYRRARSAGLRSDDEAETLAQAAAELDRFLG